MTAPRRDLGPNNLSASFLHPVRSGNTVRSASRPRLAGPGPAGLRCLAGHCAHLSIVSGILAFHVNPPCRPCRSTSDTVARQKSKTTRLLLRVSPWFKFRRIVRLHPLMLRSGQPTGETERDDRQHLAPGNPVSEVIGYGRDGLVPSDCPVPAVSIRGTQRQSTLPAGCLTRKCYRNSSPYFQPQPGPIPPSRSVPMQVHQTRRRAAPWP